MGDTRNSNLVLLLLALVILVSLTLHIDDLLQGALLKLAVRVCYGSCILLCFEVDFHLFVVEVADLCHLLADIVVFRMVPDFNLKDLTIDDVWSLLAHRGYLSCALVSHFNLNIHIDVLARINITSLEKSCLDRQHIEVSESLQVEAVVTG